MAMDAMDYDKKDDFKVAYDGQANTVNAMVNCPYFKTNFIHLTKDLNLDVSKRDSFTIYMCVSGTAEIRTEKGSTSIQKGETILVSANSKRINISTSEAKLLEVTV